MADQVIYAFSFAASGFLIGGRILTAEGQILSWWPGLIERIIFVKGKPLYKWNRIQVFFYTITSGCSKCIAGQIALWWSIFRFSEIGQGVVTVSLSIFLAWAIEKYYEEQGGRN